MSQKDAAVSLREGRIHYGWTVELAAEVYGRYARGKPVQAGTMYTIEEGCMPKDAKRRWILARMYNLAPAIFGLEIIQGDQKIPAKANVRKSRPVDVQEYQTTLLSYWKNGYSGTPEAALVDLGIRINSLHDSAFYSSEQEQMKRLLCGYHIRRANLAKELGYDRGALDHFNKAVILAKENRYIDLLASALYHRGKFHFDRYDLQKTLRDLGSAEKFSSSPPDVLGRVVSVKGMALARLASTEQEMASAMRMVGGAQSLIRPDVQEPLCTIDFSQAVYNRNYIKALLGSPEKNLHRPQEAEDLISTIQRTDTSGRLATYDKIEETLNQAIIYFDQGHYPISTTLFQDSLKHIAQGYLLYMPVVERAHEALLASPYGKSREVAELGLQLLGLQMAQVLSLTTKW